MSNDDSNQPHLKRVLGRFDLVLLFVVAVFNLNVVPSIAANGGVTVWLWIISLLLFFWPQGIAVIELAHRYPGPGRDVSSAQGGPIGREQTMAVGAAKKNHSM
jgi:amino acid transporter